MSPLDLVRLPALKEHSQGRPKITVALIDGPVVWEHPGPSGSTIREIPAKLKGAVAHTLPAATKTLAQWIRLMPLLPFSHLPTQ
jgi:hypothetical protein